MKLFYLLIKQIMSDSRKLKHAYESLVNCFKESDIPSMQESWLENIISKIPPELRIGKESELNQVLDEVQANFRNSMQGNVLQQSLKVPPIKGIEMEDLKIPISKPM